MTNREEIVAVYSVGEGGNILNINSFKTGEKKDQKLRKVGKRQDVLNFIQRNLKITPICYFSYIRVEITPEIWQHAQQKRALP